jgi:rfaE bifunctional protein nucleotidyltransferase chain/domain
VYVEIPPQKVLTIEQLLAVRGRWRQERKTVVWTNGCFDLLHIGHVRTLQEARGLGDVLVVGLNSDGSVRRLKGPTRPLVPLAERAEVLAALACVDAVVAFHDPTPEAILTQVRPDIFCKGGDYAPPHGLPVPEASLIESYGGRVAYLTYLPGVSTTELARRASQKPGDELRRLSGRPAVFLDRDGTLVEDVGYPRDPDQLRLLPGATQALAELRIKGFALVIISNQSGVGRGLLTREQADRVHSGLTGLLAEQGVSLDGAYYCYHGPDEACPCRKPSPHLLRTAADELGLDLARSFMIGDKRTDVEAGRAACSGTILLTGRPAEGITADFVAPDWPAAVDYILARTRRLL